MNQPDDIEDLLGRVWCDRYQLLEYVGRGGMGAVFKARQVQMGREVALKVIHRRLCQDEKQIQRFEQEARTSSKLNHPNNIRVFDYGTSDDGRLFMAMEFLKGKTLGQLITDEGTLHPDRVTYIARQMFKSLAEAHELGLVHRDLKPENIFICEIFGETDFVKVLDFGIAKAIGPTEEDAKLTQTGFICGTPRYLSPEQALGQAVDGRADLYSVGVLMYEMLTGRPPFIGENPISIVMKHVHDDPPPIVGVERYGERARKLIWLVERLLEKNPARRPSPAERIVDFLDGKLEESALVGQVGPALGRSRGPKSLRKLTPLPQVPGNYDVDGAVPRSAFRDLKDGSEITTSRRAAISPVDLKRVDAIKPPPLPRDAMAELPDATTERGAARMNRETSVVPASEAVAPTAGLVPASDETALIARPAALQGAQGDTRPGETQKIQSTKETRLISQEALASAARESGKASVSPKAMDSPPPPPPVTRAPVAHSKEASADGPLWAWALAGVAIAVMVLSVFTYTWSRSQHGEAPVSSSAPDDPANEQAQVTVQGELTGRALATIEVAPKPTPELPVEVESEASTALPASAPVAPATASPPPAPDMGTAGGTIGALLASVALPEPEAPRVLTPEENLAEKRRLAREAAAAEMEARREVARAAAAERKAKAEAKAAERKAQREAAAAERAARDAERKAKAEAKASERKAQREAAAAERKAKAEAAAAARKAAAAERAAKRAAERQALQERRAAAKAERERKEAEAKRARAEAKAKAKKSVPSASKSKKKRTVSTPPKKKAAKKPAAKKKAPPKKAEQPSGDPFEPF